MSICTRQADVAERAGKPHPQAAVRLVDPDGVDAERPGVEENAVVGAGHGAHGFDGGAGAGVVGGGEEVHIAGRPHLLLGPHAEEGCALEREPVHLVGRREAGTGTVRPRSARAGA